MSDRARILITLEGGLVSSVCVDPSIAKTARVVVADYDVEGADEDRLTKIMGDDAVVAEWQPESNDAANQSIEDAYAAITKGGA